MLHPKLSARHPVVVLSPVVVLQVSIVLSGGARESRDNISGLPNGLNKGIMGWGSTNQVLKIAFELAKATHTNDDPVTSSVLHLKGRVMSTPAECYF